MNVTLSAIRVAVFDVSHWHAPLARVGLQAAGCAIVAVTGPADLAEDWKQAFGSRVHGSPEELLAREEIDFAFVFGSHREQTATARMVLERGIGCSIEKPGGLCARDVAGLAELSQRTGTFASVPFVNRLHPVVREAADLAREHGAPFHCAFTDVAGTPDRYVEAHCPWMLDPARSGGGCLINLGIHFIDLFAHLVGAPPRLTGAMLSNAVRGLAIEDHARVLLEAPVGRSASIEVGYTHPDRNQRHQAITIVGDGWLVAATPADTRIFDRGASRRQRVELDAGPLYADYVQATLAAFAAGAPPVASLTDLHQALTIIDAAYAGRDGDGDAATQPGYP